MSTSAPPAPDAAPPHPLVPEEGWIVQHLFYHVDHGYWAALTPEEKAERVAHFEETLGSIRSHPKTQLLAFSMVSSKAELGFILLTPDLHDSNQFEKQLALALGPEVLTPNFSYLSMTEWTEYSEKEE